MSAGQQPAQQPPAAFPQWQRAAMSSSSLSTNAAPNAQPRRQVPRRTSSYATVVPAASPLEPTGSFFGGKSAGVSALPVSSQLPHPPPTPLEYQTPTHLNLTPLRAHYLKRELVGGQLARELSALADPDALSIIGWPFDVRRSQSQSDAPTSNNNNPTQPTTNHLRRLGDDGEELDLPFLRFFLHHFVMTFPFLSQVDSKTFYSRKLQPFIESFMARNISMNEEREEATGTQTKRHKLAGKAEKHIGLLISSAVKLSDNNGREEVVRIVDVKSAPQPGTASPPPVPPKDSGSGALTPGSSKGIPPQQDVFQVNVVGVRTASTKGRLGMKSKHEEFLVRTSRPHAPDIFVSRRYGDFVSLSEMLRRDFPDFDIRAPPAKDKRGVDSSAVASAAATPATPLTASTISSTSTRDSTESDVAPTIPGVDSAPTTVLSRERNRLTLRAYLRQLLSMQEVANSPTLRAFLTQETTTLTPAEQADAQRREEMDKLREAETDKFRSEVEGRVKELERYLRIFKDDLVQKNGLSRMFGTIRETPDLRNLPVEYQKVMEWARISMASTIYQLFVGSDNSSAVFAQFKRVHGLMPYFMMRQILKISNPVAMIRAALDLFLARPFGSASLLQRMFSSGLESEVRELKDDMLKVQAKINDPAMCERVRRYVRASREVQKRYRTESEKEDLDILTVIMRDGEATPPLTPQGLQRVHRASIKYREYQAWVATLEDPEEDDEGPDNDDAWLFEDLHVFMRMYMRLRDKEQILELIFEGNTSDLLKDIITIFYEPLAKVYKAANIGNSLYDLQLFIDDLIKTVESAELSMATTHVDPQRTVTIFMDLVQRHEGNFYAFVHQVHSKGEDLFDGLMHWIELFLNLIRDGLNPEGIMLDFLLPAGGTDRANVMREIDALIDYHRTLKIAHHERLRRRLVKGEIAGAASYVTGSGVVGSPGQVGFGGTQNAETDAAFIDSVLKNMSLSGVADDIDDLNAEHEEDSDEEAEIGSDDFVDAVSEVGTPTLPDTARSTASQGSNLSVPSSSYMTQTTLVVQLPTKEAGPPGKKGKGQKGPKATKIAEPELVHIPKLVPVFAEMLRPSLESAQRVQMLKAQQQQPSRTTQAAQASIWRPQF